MPVKSLLFTVAHICSISLLFGGCLFFPDVGTEELGHLEMIGAIVHQLTRSLNDSQIKEAGFAPYFVDHTIGVYPTAASGSPWNAASMAVKGDPMADLVEDLAADAASLFSPHQKLQKIETGTFPVSLSRLPISI